MVQLLSIVTKLFGLLDVCCSLLHPYNVLGSMYFKAKCMRTDSLALRTDPAVQGTKAKKNILLEQGNNLPASCCFHRLHCYTATSIKTGRVEEGQVSTFSFPTLLLKRGPFPCCFPSTLKPVSTATGLCKSLLLLELSTLAQQMQGVIFQRAGSHWKLTVYLQPSCCNFVKATW